MDARFRVTDLDTSAWQKGRGVVGVDFIVNGCLVDSPDLWFDSGTGASQFYEEARRRGWTTPAGVAITPGNEDAIIGELARAFGGDWWTGWRPDWGKGP